MAFFVLGLVACIGTLISLGTALAIAISGYRAGFFYESLRVAALNLPFAGVSGLLVYFWWVLGPRIFR